MNKLQTGIKTGATILAGAAFALLLALPVAAWKSEYREGKSLVEAGAYGQAIAQFELALQDDRLRQRDREKIQQALENARRRAAAEAYASGERLARAGESVGALNAFKRAADYDPENTAYAQRYLQEKQGYESRFEQVRNIRTRALNSGDYASAITAMELMVQEGGNDPALLSELDRLRQEAVAVYTVASDDGLAAKRYDSAYESMAMAQRYSSDPQVRDRTLARKHLMLSSKALQRRDYTTAYNELDRALQLEPGNPAILAFEQEFKGQQAGILYNEAVAARTGGNLALARQRLSTLSQMQPGYLDVDTQLYEVNQAIASTYYSRAEQLLQQRSRDDYGRALAYYLLAAEQQSAVFPDIGDRIDECKRLLRQELEFRVALEVTNSAAEPGVQGVVRDQILAAMRNNSALKSVNVLERDKVDDILREQGLGQAFFDPETALEVKKIKGVQAGLYVDVVKLEAFETGADRPRYGSVTYENGTRLVHNRRYDELQGEVSRAQQEVVRAQQELNQAKAEQNRAMQQMQNNPSDNPWSRAAGALSVMSSSLSEGALRDAQNYLDRVQSELSYEPRQIEEPVMSSWRYEIFDLALQGEAVLSYKVVNFTTSEIGDVQSVSARETLVDTYIPGDPGKGVETDPNDLPSIEEFKNVLLQKGNADLIARLASQFGDSSDSYFQAGQSAASDGLEDEAIENYMRFMYSTPDLGAARVQLANQYIYDQLGLSLLRRSQ